MGHVTLLAKREPWEAALGHSVADESPASVPRHAVPRHVGLRQCLGRHRLYRVTPQSHDAAHGPFFSNLMHGAPP